jgi:hypothetical protein
VGVTWGDGAEEHHHTTGGADAVSVRALIGRWVRAVWRRLFTYGDKA